jgi:hypothetical protein
MIFEGPMIITAVAAMTAFHPGSVFGNLWVPAGKGVRSAGKILGDGSSVELNNTTDWNTSYQRVNQPNAA